MSEDDGSAEIGSLKIKIFSKKTILSNMFTFVQSFSSLENLVIL